MVHRDIKSRNVFLCRTWFWPHFPCFFFSPPVPGARFLIAKCIPRPPFLFYTPKGRRKAQFWWLPKQNLVGGNSKIFDFHPYLGKMNPIWLIFFQRGWFNHQQKQHPQGPAVRSWVTLVWYDYWSPPVTWHTPVWERPITSVLSFLDKNHQGEGRWNIDLSELPSLKRTVCPFAALTVEWMFFLIQRWDLWWFWVEGRGLCFRMFQKSRLPGAGSPDSHPCTTCQDHPQTALQLQDRCLESRGVAIWNGSTETSLYGNLRDLAQDHHQRRCLVNLFSVMLQPVGLMVCNL